MQVASAEKKITEPDPRWEAPPARETPRLRGILLGLGLALAYCGAHFLLGHLKTINVLYAATLLALYFLSLPTRVFMVLAIPILAQNVLYDSLRYIPFDWIKPVLIGPLYSFDKLLFGVSHAGSKWLLNDYVLLYSHHFLDISSGFIYHSLDPFIFVMLGIFWRLKSLDLAQRYSTAFLVMNLFAFATYVLSPAAAPWYVAKYGFAQPFSEISGFAAGLTKFDQLTGVRLSSQIYGMNPFPFGALPSMHAGFTLLAWLYTFYLSRRWVLGIGLYCLLMAAAAIYLQHHYVVDLLAGGAYAGLAFALVEKPLLAPTRRAWGRIMQSLVTQAPPPLFKNSSLRATPLSGQPVARP
jgi:PAP2 superfamily.